MYYVIESGTDILVRTQRHNSAEEALDAVLDLVSARHPNIRIKDGHERHLRLHDLWRRVAIKNVGARRPIRFPPTTFG
jgi:hypothetical protein